MAKLVRQSHGQRGLIGKDIEQAAAHYNGVPDSERFQWRCQEHAATDIRNNLKVIRDDQVVDDGLQNLVDITYRCNQANFLKMVQRVVFCGALPHALRLNRTGFPGGISLITDRVYLNFCELLIVFERFRIVAPEACLSFEVQSGE